MKRKSWKIFLVVVPLALFLTSCGSKSPDEEEQAQQQAVINTPDNGGGGQPNNPPPAPPAVCNKQVITESIHQFNVSGTGTGTATSGTFNADQTIKIRVTPQSSGGSYAYSYLAADVELRKNGTVVSGSTVHVPQSGYSYLGGPEKGMPVGQYSGVIDLSSYVTSGSGNYSIRVKNALTDYKCQQYCLSSYYCQWVYDPWWGWVWQCDQYMINQCVQLKCDVGDLQGLSGASWSVKIEVETDTTPCLE